MAKTSLPRGRRVAIRNALQIRVLGELSVLQGEQPLPLPQSRKTRALLGYLVLTGRPHRRDRLCSLLWDVADDPRGALRWSLSRLRPIVDQSGVERIATDREYVWFEAKGARVDALEIKRSLRQGVQALDFDTLRAHVDAHRGVLLEGLDLPDFHEFQSWCVAQREELRLLRVQALRELIVRLLDQEAEALPYARTLVQLDPLDEEARVDLIRLLVALGRRAEAEQHVESGERQIRELGGLPSGVLTSAWRELAGSPRVPRASSHTALSPVPERAPTPPDATEAPLVGRAVECERLQTLVETVERSGRLRVVLVSGEPGAGKTRLVSTLLALVRTTGGTVLDGRAYEAESGRPYGPWIDALRRVPAPNVSETLSAQLARLLPELAAPAGEQSRAELFAAVVELIGTRAERAAPVLVAIDDAQWLDTASAELLHYAVRMSQDRPVLVALAARAGEIVDNAPLQRVLRGLRREQVIEEIELGPLTRDETVALVYGDGPHGDPDRMDAIHRQSAGNPLFALELARAASWEEGQPSATLADLVRERVERLAPACGDVLRWCAAFGRTVHAADLSGLTALPPDELMAALGLLERHGLLRAEAGGYLFGHDVVRQVLYTELSGPRRQIMHSRIARHLAAFAPDDDVVAADIARHAALGGDAAMAVRACVRAGRRCLRLFANHEALGLARRGARYVSEVSEPERTKMALDLWDVQLAATRPENVEAVAAELEQLAERALDHGCMEHARLGFHLLSYLRWEGNAQADAARHMLHAERVTRGIEGGDRVIALAEAARCLVLLDRDHGDAEALALEARALASRTGVDTPAIADAIGLLRVHQGEFEEAERRFRESREQARETRLRAAEFQALEHLVMLDLRRGNATGALVLARELLELAARLRDGSEEPLARALAATATYAGNSRASDELDIAVADLRLVDAKQRLGFVLATLAEIDLAHGHHRDARARAEEALALARALDRPSDLAWARILIARAAAVQGDVAEVQVQLAELRTCDLGQVATHVRSAATELMASGQGGH